MKKLIIIILFLNLNIVFSQTKKDSILSELRNETEDSGISFRQKSDSTKIIVYKLCEYWYDKVYYLKSNLTENDISELKTEKNTSLNIIGLICELEKNNTKENAMKIINNLKKSEMKFMTYNCSDAISVMSNSRYFLSLLTNKNFFFKPEFKLKKKEIRKIENEILIAESEFWKN